VCCTDPCAPEPTPFTETFPDGIDRRVFQWPGGQLLLVVEGRTVDGGLPAVGSYTQPNPVLGDHRPDIQIEATQALGKGSAAVCDDGSHAPVTDGGGVFPLPTPDFSLEPNPQPLPGTVTGALYDFGCRFEYHTTGNQCTTWQNPDAPYFLGVGSTAQFCDRMASTAYFNPGDTMVTVRLRDEAGNIGPTAQIVVRIITPTPHP
jgi:hypothetical protein